MVLGKKWILLTKKPIGPERSWESDWAKTRFTNKGVACHTKREMDGPPLFFVENQNGVRLLGESGEQKAEAIVLDRPIALRPGPGLVQGG